MRLAAFFPKRKQSSDAEHALVYLCFHGPFCIGCILISEDSLIGAGIIYVGRHFLS